MLYGVTAYKHGQLMCNPFWH